MNQSNDRPLSAGTPNTLRGGLRRWIQRAALTAATNDIAVAERFLRVRGLLDPPARLQDPALLFRILVSSVRRSHFLQKLWQAAERRRDMPR
jgi:hypothetical protein